MEKTPSIRIPYKGMRKFLCEAGQHSPSLVRDEDGEMIICRACGKSLEHVKESNEQ